MGCDIHLHLERHVPEVLDPAGVATREAHWEPVDWRITKCWFCKGTGRNPKPQGRQTHVEGAPCHRCTAPLPSVYDAYELKHWTPLAGWVRESWYSGRNYDLFAILANVRNDGSWEQVVPLRGFPDDASYQVVEDYEGWGDDAHSPSWITLEELFAFDWTKSGVDTGVVSLVEYQQYKANGEPDSWCGAIGGPAIEMVTPAEMEALIAAGVTKTGAGKDPYTTVSWGRTYEEACRELLMNMREAQKMYEGETLRMVFWFDN